MINMTGSLVKAWCLKKKWGYPEDVGRAAASLARGDFAYATGLILELSGGMNIRHL